MSEYTIGLTKADEAGREGLDPSKRIMMCRTLSNLEIEENTPAD